MRLYRRVVSALSSLVLASSLGVVAPSVAGAQTVLPTMVGRWRGDADITVEWTKTRTLTVDLTIASNDSVQGKVGDARFSGSLLRNRGWIGRWFGGHTEYRITGTLDGAIIRSEDITRDAVTLSLNWTNGRFEGSLETTGSRGGGADVMAIAASGLVLRRQPDLWICGVAPAPVRR